MGTSLYEIEYEVLKRPILKFLSFDRNEFNSSCNEKMNLKCLIDVLYTSVPRRQVEKVTVATEQLPLTKKEEAGAASRVFPQHVDEKVINSTVPTNSSSRVCRLTSNQIQNQKELDKKLKSNCIEGLAVIIITENRGRGIITTRAFKKGEFLVNFEDEHYCIDATQETDKLGRFINHSREQTNIDPKIIKINSQPRLYLQAKIHISDGTEILYDYRDRRKDILKSHAWLNNW